MTGDYIDRFLKYELLPLDSVPCYEYDEMLDLVHKGYDGSITKEAAAILMKRGMGPAYSRGKYFFSRDPRLKVKYLSYSIIFSKSDHRITHRHYDSENIRSVCYICTYSCYF